MTEPNLLDISVLVKRLDKIQNDLAENAAERLRLEADRRETIKKLAPGAQALVDVCATPPPSPTTAFSDWFVGADLVVSTEPLSVSDLGEEYARILATHAIDMSLESPYQFLLWVKTQSSGEVLTVEHVLSLAVPSWQDSSNPGLLQDCVGKLLSAAESVGLVSSELSPGRYIVVQ